jgi:CMP-N,N'-diacetyllegionaminic acid synthase
LASSESVIRHALDFYEKMGRTYDYVLLLQPTSPLRQLWHLKEALDLIKSDTELLISVKESEANPYYNLFIDDLDQGLVKFAQSNFTRRQDCPKIYESVILPVNWTIG